MRGLKRTKCNRDESDIPVAPLVGAWIETNLLLQRETVVKVAPLVGAWIETNINRQINAQQRVAPLVGAWIETDVSNQEHHQLFCRTPRGCVD